MNIYCKCLLFLMLLCSTNALSQESYSYTIPEKTNDGFLTTHLKKVGLDSEIISEAVAEILKKKYKNIHSFLIIKDNQLVLEEYFPGYKYEYDKPEFRGKYTEFDRNTPHNLASITKSITSSLVGIAIEKGFINSPNEKLFSFFPKYASDNDETKDKITLAHLLTMTSGLQWNENSVSYGNNVNDIVQLFVVPDPIGYILKKPSVNTPASGFNYNGGGTNLLGEIIKRTSGRNLDEFSDKYLFKPLAITSHNWGFIKPDLVYASGDMKMKPRDMAKFGYLYLNGGKWNGKEVISDNWVKMSLTKHVSLIPEKTGYGFNWWQKTYMTGSKKVNTFAAEGWGGQKIILFQDYNMLIVFTGGNYTQQDPIDEIITEYVIPAFLGKREK